MINLPTYIKNEFIKNKFYESCQTINSLEDAEIIAHKVAEGNKYNIIFKTSVIKEQFFDVLNILRQDVSIINCNSCYERFEESIDKATGLIIFNNINKCSDLNILESIKINKGIFVC